MADYKDLISGTLKNLAGKVKDMADTVGVSDVYTKGIERTKSYGTMAKLTLSINSDTEELKRVYQEIGRLYYEDTKDAPEGFYASLFSQVEKLNAGIDEKRCDIDAIKAELDSSSQSDIDVEISELPDGAAAKSEAAANNEFEAVVNSTESDGTGKKE